MTRPTSESGGRILVDASTLIVLGSIGQLHVLKRIFPRIHTTRVVETEATAGHHPETATIESALRKGWIQIVPRPVKKSSEPWEELGLGPGEASLFDVARPEDILIIDDRNARRYAEAHGYHYIGILGVIVHAATDGVLQPKDAKEVVDAIARSSFRMTVDLYQWAIQSIDQADQESE